MPALSKEDKLRLLTILLESRHGDLREQNLNRQGKGHFHVSGMGHEALAAISDSDATTAITSAVIIAIARWCSAAADASRELALDYFAKRETGKPRPADAVALQLAARHLERADADRLATVARLRHGLGNQTRRQKPNVVVATIGDAATRQGDFYEAVCFAKERKLPVLFVVEDNDYGISSPTRKINPLRARCSSSLTTGWRSTEPMCRRFTTRRGSVRGDARRQRSAFFLGQHGAALQPHQLGRPQTLSQRRRTG